MQQQMYVGRQGIGHEEYINKTPLTSASLASIAILRLNEALDQLAS